MQKTFDNPTSVAPPVSNSSHAVRVNVGDGALIFVSGQGPQDARRQVVGGADLAAQTRQTFGNVRAILEAQRATLGDVVKMTVDLTDMTRRAEMARVRGEFFPHDPPAATAVRVAALALPELLIQVDVIAAAGRRA
ncbi:enamine deaminase RidA (plasmid) [Deinococcus aetherius]|uniref:Enamine deaminase RidA n=1 Tax=Deinococcus aetherius TaxID=200252 RepID=A0ABN6RLH7_9DEIO|nr:RidA family protein [Deinococcus aetherius]BDP43680.1 enamine deaminase RidA [Deinococcus aetherius]